MLGSKDSFRAGDPGATALNTKAALDIGTQRVGRRVGTRVGGSGGVPLEVLGTRPRFCPCCLGRSTSRKGGWELLRNVRPIGNAQRGALLCSASRGGDELVCGKLRKLFPEMG